MKKMLTAVALLGLSLPVAAQAMEFQTPGALGMGRAGVARTTDAYATFINPAGLAFYQRAFSTRLNALVGVAVTSNMADNIDKVGKLELDDGASLSFTSTSTPAEVASATTKAAQFAGVLTNLNEKRGDLSLNADLSLGFQFRNFGLGLFGTSDLGAFVGNVDLVNVRVGDSATNFSPTVSQFAALLGASAGTSTGVATYFSQAAYDQLVLSYQAAGAASLQEARDLTSKLETELSADGVNTTGLTPDQIAQGLQVIAPTLGTTGGTIDNNTTTVLLRGIAIAEIPLAYGHKFDLGRFGKLGIGGSAKVMMGTVYSSDVEVMNLEDSDDAADRIDDEHAESTKFGVDLGALWRLEGVKYIGPINVGLALKNLNSPEFDGPRNPITGAVTKVKVEPQARLGFALDPLSWLSIAADLDLTKNKSVTPGRESQLFGGGIEAHFDHWYALWLALRVGAYKNIAQDSSKPVITAGLSLGPKYLRLDINGAVATEKGRYDNKSVPLEGKVEFGLSTAFF